MNKNFKRKFGAKVRHYRKLNNLSQEQLAELIGMSPNTISYIENGKNNISFAKLGILANVLNIQVHQLFFNTDCDENQQIKEKIIELLNIANKKQLGIFLNLIKDILDT